MWSTPVTDLRRLMSDGPQDKRAHQKRTVPSGGDGEQTIFKTLETRYVPGSLQVFVDGVLQTITTEYTESDPVAGEFTFVTAPGINTIVKASYYWRHFGDDELQQFIDYAAFYLGYTVAALVEEGLRPAAIHKAASDAWARLSVFWQERRSEQFILEESPSVGTPTAEERQKEYSDAADIFLKRADRLRDDFYKRQGRRHAPAQAILAGAVHETTPRR